MAKKRFITKRTFGLISAGLALFFLTIQIVIFQATSYVGDCKVTFIDGEQTNERLFHEAHVFVDGKSYELSGFKYTGHH